MPVRFLSDAQREQLSGFPAELEPESLDRFFTLSGPDLAEVRRRHGEEMDKVVLLRGLGAGEWDLGTLPAKRVAALARWAKTASNQALAQSAPERRYTALLALGAERLVEVTDQPRHRRPGAPPARRPPAGGT